MNEEELLKLKEYLKARLFEMGFGDLTDEEDYFDVEEDTGNPPSVETIIQKMLKKFAEQTKLLDKSFFEAQLGAMNRALSSELIQTGDGKFGEVEKLEIVFDDRFALSDTFEKYESGQQYLSFPAKLGDLSDVRKAAIELAENINRGPDFGPRPDPPSSPRRGRGGTER